MKNNTKLQIRCKDYRLGISFNSPWYVGVHNLVQSRFFTSSSLLCFSPAGKNKGGLQKDWEDHVIDMLEYGGEYIPQKKFKKLAERIYKDGASIDLNKILKENCSDLDATKVGDVYLNELKDKICYSGGDNSKIIHPKSWLGLQITKSKSKFNKKQDISFSSSSLLWSNRKHMDLNSVQICEFSSESYKRKEWKQNILFEGVKNIIDNNPNNKDTQIKIEKLLLSLSKHDENNGLNTYEIIGRLNKNLKEVLIKSSEDLFILINNFKRRKVDKIYNEESIKELDRPHYYMSIILNDVDTDFIISILLGKFLVLINNPKQEDNNCINIFGDLGKQTVQNYFYALYLKEKRNKKLDSSNYFMSGWRKENKGIIDMYTNNLEHKIGALLIDWMREIDLLEIDLIRSLEDSKQNINVLKPTKRIMPLIYKLKPLNLPQKLPMIVKPKPYTDTKLGGYILNDEMYTEPMIIDKVAYKDKSKVLKDNIIYTTINNMSCTPTLRTKVNKDLLDYLLRYNSEHNLLINPDYKHELEDLKSRTKNQEKQYQSFLSKKILQEFVINIAQTYSNIYEIYFPVKLDNRGRIYTTPSYFNYQSTELSKALISFAIPGIITRNNHSAI